ncbi:MAG: hypothetical protein ABI373_05270 [Flavobacteriales bacterium]
MRAVLLLLIGLCLHTRCTAQECYLVDSIRFDVAAPTTEDALSLMLYGDLIGVRTSVISASATVEDHQIVIQLEVSCDTNTESVISHREKLPLNGLTVGRYHMRLTGSGAALMDTASTLFVAPYAGRYQTSEAPAEMVHFDAGADEFIIDIDPSVHVLRVHIHGTDAKLEREAYIDGFGPSRISAKGLPEGNYLVCVDSDTGTINGWATIDRKQ